MTSLRSDSANRHTSAWCAAAASGQLSPQIANCSPRSSSSASPKPPQVVEHFHRLGHARAEVGLRHSLALGRPDPAADPAQQRVELLLRELFPEHVEEDVEEEVVRLREELLGLGGERVEGLRLPDAGPLPRLTDEPVPFERSEVGADGVVREPERSG
jgi:hypothetical protein